MRAKITVQFDDPEVTVHATTAQVSLANCGAEIGRRVQDAVDAMAAETAVALEKATALALELTDALEAAESRAAAADQAAKEAAKPRAPKQPKKPRHAAVTGKGSK